MDNEEKTVDWHPGFVNAIKLEFFENESELEYESEKNLNQQPLRIDLLVVKKNPSTVIKNDIGKDFLGHNIIEFKSENDELNIDTIFKVLGYACLYKSYGTGIDSIKSNDITVTLMRKSKPLKLFKMLNGQISTSINGIYKISGFQFPIQIVVTGELEDENHIWVSSLATNLSDKKLKSVIKKAKLLQSKAEKQYAESVMSVISRLNTDEIERLKKEDATMCKDLYEIMKPEIDEKIDEAVSKNVLKTLLDAVKNLMKNMSLTPEKSMDLLSVAPEYRAKILSMI